LKYLGALIALLIAADPGVAQTSQEGAPPIPMDIPVFLVGDSRIDGAGLQPYEGVWSIGSVGKAGPLEIGEKIQAGNVSVQKLERVELDGRPVWRRTIIRKPAGSDTVLATISVYLEVETLKPLRATILQPGRQEMGFVYDWDEDAIHTLGGPSGAGVPPVMSMDLKMLEAGAHDVWMAALPYEEGFTAKIPVLMASAGAKYWAVPRVVGSETVDLGDGTQLDAWVVELDWWGIAGDSSYFPGGGRNDTAGTGGKYWILKNPPPGVGKVFRVQTEIDRNTDVVIQMQNGLGEPN
jgi:hypothetical protein